MGYSVLYIAFGIVALWLLGEVLAPVQGPAALAAARLAGFMGVVGEWPCGRS